MKHFGPTSTAPVPREPFTLTVMRDDEPEDHQFNARAMTDVTGLATVLTLGDKHAEKAIGGVMRIIAKMLDNKDGVSASWRPEVLPEPDDAPEDFTPQFRNPSGELEDFTPENTARYTRFEAGSSKRRWLYLVEEDDEATVDEGQLMRLFGWLMGLAGKGRGPQSR